MLNIEYSGRDTFGTMASILHFAKNRECIGMNGEEIEIDDKIEHLVSHSHRFALKTPCIQDCNTDSPYDNVLQYCQLKAGVQCCSHWRANGKW